MNSNHPLDIRDQVMLGSYDITKDLIKQHAEQLMELIDNGHTDAISIAIQAKYLTEVLEATKERIRELVCDELHKYAKGEECTKHGATFALKEAGVSYDYSGCGDPTWNEFNETLSFLKEKMKERKQFKKDVKSGKIVKVAESTNGDAAQRSAERNNGTVRYKKGVYSVYVNK